MKQIAWLFKWLLKAAIFFTLFAFALNNQGDTTVHFFFGYRWTAPMVLVVLGAFASGLVIGVLGMVPRWWRHRRDAVQARLAASQAASVLSSEARKQTPLPDPMDFDITLILLGLPVAFVLGWVASRMDLRQLRMENRQAPKAYFKGLNFLLNEQQDQAIDAFIEAVQNDPDTSELHFALGNLFRRRGEYERAVRVHQHLLERGDLSLDDRHRAQHALALDYLKAGLLDRAEDALLKLEGSRFEAQSRLALLANYERSRDWANAAVIAQKLESSGQGSFKGRLSHYLCEQAADRIVAKDLPQAKNLLAQATAIAPDAPRPRMDLARLQHQQGEHLPAFDTLMQALEAAPSAVALMAPLIAGYATDAHQGPDALAHLKAIYAENRFLDVLDAIVALEAATGDTTSTARDWYAHHLENEPSLVAAAKWIAGEKLEHEQFHPQVQRALDHAVKPLTRYRCAACGFEAKQHFWQCPGCQAWDSYPARRVEEL